MEKFHKLLKKKLDEGHTLHPAERDAKMGVLKDLHKMASDSMADKIHGIKKVSVMAPDEEGLSHGLDAAKHIVSDMPGMLDDAEDADDRHGDMLAGGSGEHPSMEADEGEEMDGDQAGEEDEAAIDAKLAHLMAKKHALQSRKA